MLDRQEENLARFTGTLETTPEFDHQAFGKVYYKCNIKVKRRSSTYDTIPLIIEERLSDDLKAGMRVEVEGEVHTRNMHDNRGKSHLRVYVKVQRVSEAYGTGEDQNEVFMLGYLCKKPTFRVTPQGRKITDIMLACNRRFGRTSAYIPCIAWEKLACDISYMGIGDKLNIRGRFQSREYLKKLPDGSSETRTAYELSIMELI